MQVVEEAAKEVTSSNGNNSHNPRGDSVLSQVHLDAEEGKDVLD
jgi:hypothetical protein